MVYHHVPSFMIPKILWFYVDVPSFSHHVPCVFLVPLSTMHPSASAQRLLSMLSQVPIEYRPLMCESIDPNTREISTISKGHECPDFPSRMVMDGESWWIMVKGEMAIWRYHFSIFLAYFCKGPIFCKGISPENIALYGTNVAPF